jgi:hypothetical protein
LTSTIANFIIEYNWWKEVGQVETWISMLWYSIAPSVAGALVAFIALWVAHAQGLHFAGVRRRDFRVYSRLVPVGLAVVAILFASASIDYWTIMRFFGSRGGTLPSATWTDPVFSRALSFYLSGFAAWAVPYPEQTVLPRKQRAHFSQQIVGATRISCWSPAPSLYLSVTTFFPPSVCPTTPCKTGGIHEFSL